MKKVEAENMNNRAWDYPTDGQGGSVMSRRARRWQQGLIGLGILITVYLTILHYDVHVPLVCSDRGFIDCASVLHSPESQWLGLPVSLYGLVWFLVYGGGIIRRPHAVWLPRVWALSGVATVLYLVAVEFVVLHTLCLWCSSLHGIILALWSIELAQWIRVPDPRVS